MFIRRYAWVGLTVAIGMPIAAQQFTESSVAWDLDFEHVAGADHFLDTPLPDGVMQRFCQSGFAIGDIDGDGIDDLVICGSLNAPAIFKNTGSAMVDRTEESGVTGGAFFRTPALADYDRDGDLDLFLSALVGGEGPRKGEGRLYQNDGAGRFTDVTTLAGLTGSGHSIYAKWADLDSDGWPDLTVAEFHNTDNNWYRNNGDGTFLEMASEIGFANGGTAHVLTVFDSDEDGYQDIFVGNDYIAHVMIGYQDPIKDEYYHGQPDFTVADLSVASQLDVGGGIMGFTVADVNGDGFADIYKSNVGPNPLNLNFGYPNGAPWTREETLWGIEADLMENHNDPPNVGPAVSWGAGFCDFDHDKALDLFVVNGAVPTSISILGPRNFLFRGEPTGSFMEIGPPSFGLYDHYDDRALAVADFNLDGSMDLLVGPTSGPSRLFINEVSQGNWIKVRARAMTSYPDGSGSKVTINDGATTQYRWIGVDAPAASQPQPVAHCGLGEATTADVTIRFPSGMTLSVVGAPANQELNPVEPLLLAWSKAKQAIGAPALGAPGSIGSAVGNAGNPGQFGGRKALSLVHVDAFAFSQTGQMLDGTASVQIDSPNLVPVTGVVHLKDNHFRRTFQAPVQAGAHRAQVTFDGWAVGIQPQIHFYNPADMSGTDVRTNIEAGLAGSHGKVIAQVAPKTGRGISLGEGLSVSLTLGGALPLKSSDLGAGLYEFEFGVPITPGVYNFEGLVQGSPITTSTSFVSAGAADFSSFDVVEDPPAILNSPDPRQMHIFITPRDAQGRRLGPGVDLQLVATPQGHTLPVVVRPELITRRPNGEHVFVVQKPNTGDCEGVFDVVLNNALVGTLPYDF